MFSVCAVFCITIPMLSGQCVFGVIIKLFVHCISADRERERESFPHKKKYILYTMWYLGHNKWQYYVGTEMRIFSYFSQFQCISKLLKWHFQFGFMNCEWKRKRKRECLCHWDVSDQWLLQCCYEEKKRKRCLRKINLLKGKFITHKYSLVRC